MLASPSWFMFIFKKFTLSKVAGALFFNFFNGPFNASDGLFVLPCCMLHGRHYCSPGRRNFGKLPLAKLFLSASLRII